MDEAAERLLKHFAQACSNVPLSPNDWRHLYHFTLDTHCRGLNTDQRTVRDYLIKRGYSLQQASWVSARYQHFSELVSLDGHEKTL